MKAQEWFFDGKTFLSPTWKQQGKQHIINARLKQSWLNSIPKERKLSFSEKLKAWLQNKPIKEEVQKIETKPLTKAENEGTYREFF